MKLKLVARNEIATSKVARNARRREIERKLQNKPYSKVIKDHAKLLEAAEDMLHELDN